MNGKTPEGRDEIARGLELAGLWPVVERISLIHHVCPRAVIGTRRHQSTTRARRHVWAVIRWTLGMSYPEIGRMFGVDHSSVIVGVRKYEQEIGEVM